MADTSPRKRPSREPADLDRVVCADNLVWMASLSDDICDLIYIDPPFMTNTVRTQASGQSYDDRWSGGLPAYLAFLKERLLHMRRLLGENGTLYVHLDPRVCHHVRLLLDEIFGAKNFLNEIVWSYRTGGRSTRWFARKHDTILAYAKRLGSHTFNLQRAGAQAFRTEGLQLDENNHPYKMTRKGRLYFHADGPALTDVWEIPFLSTVSRERTGYPSQKPEALLERLVRASSNEGDVVADFFCGSGTTPAVAKRCGRRWLACDVSEDAIAIARERLAEADGLFD